MFVLSRRSREMQANYQIELLRDIGVFSLTKYINFIIPFAVSVANNAQYAHHVPAYNNYDYSDYGHADYGHYDSHSGHYDAGHYY